jgi:hypothetical protein
MRPELPLCYGSLREGGPFILWWCIKMRDAL